MILNGEFKNCNDVGSSFIKVKTFNKITVINTKIIIPLLPANRTICQKKLDLAFVLDSSGSVGYNNFQRMKLFVKDLATTTS